MSTKQINYDDNSDEPLLADHDDDDKNIYKDECGDDAESESNFNDEVQQILERSIHNDNQQSTSILHTDQRKRSNSHRKSSSVHCTNSRHSQRITDLKQSVSKDDITNILAITRKLKPQSLLMSKLQSAAKEEEEEDSPMTKIKH